MKKILSVMMSFTLLFAALFVPDMKSRAADNYSFSGTAHIQTYGNRDGTWDSTTLKLGTTGEAKRLESVTINFVNHTGYSGSIEYRVHRQTYGWTDWVKNGKPAGTTGEAKRLEAIQLRLTGELADHYSIKYRVHIQTYGWSQGWQYDGALAGTEGEAKRLEALEIRLVPKNSEAMGVMYRVHRQTYGWETDYRKNGATSGTTGQAKRLEGIEISLTGNAYSGSIRYKTHVQTYGWMNEVENGMLSGTTGQAKRLEAIEISLTGEIASHYDIYYKVHAQTYGWLGWAKNGEPAGTKGLAKRLEAIQIMLVEKDGKKPDSGNGAFVEQNQPGTENTTGGTTTGGTTTGGTATGGTTTEAATEEYYSQHDWDAKWTEHTGMVKIADGYSYPETAPAYHCRDCGKDSFASEWIDSRCPHCKETSNFITAYDMPTGKTITVPPVYEEQTTGYTLTIRCTKCGEVRSFECDKNMQGTFDFGGNCKGK